MVYMKIVMEINYMTTHGEVIGTPISIHTKKYLKVEYFLKKVE